MKIFHYTFPVSFESKFTPTFTFHAPARKSAAIAMYRFEPHDSPEDGTVGAPWSPALDAHYQYLPDARPGSSRKTAAITPPAGSTGVTITVKPWKEAMARDVPVGDVHLAVDVDENTQFAADRTDFRDPSGDIIEVNREPAPGFSVYTKLPDLPIHYRATRRRRDDTDSLLVLMPSALNADRPDRSKQIVRRFSWADCWPAAEVIAVADPVLQLSSALNGAWFIHPEHDVIAAIGQLAAEIADDRGIPGDRITFYGSSLGGFGAIGAASTLDGARAVAEVPQIYFLNWGKAAIRDVEVDVIHEPMQDFAKDHPERVELSARILHSGRIPAIRLITNPTEIRRQEQWEFFEWARESSLPKSGPFEMVTTNSAAGHSVLDRETLRRLVIP